VKPLTARWVFVLKRNAEGEVERAKARLVARGFEQRFGRDVFKTFSPVPRLETVRTFLTIVELNGWVRVQFDIATASLHRQVEEEVFMEPPQGVVVPQNKCLKLIKALYGLRQAPKVWNQALDEALSEMNFKQIKSDACVYRNSDASIIILIYVDDGIVAAKSKKIAQKVIEELSNRFKVREMSGSMFLGIELVETTSGLKLSQTRYVDDILKRFNMADAKPSETLYLERIEMKMDINRLKPPIGRR